MGQPNRTHAASLFHLLFGLPVGQDDGGLTDNSVTVPFEATCQERSDGSVVCMRHVHAGRLGHWLIAATMLLIFPGGVIYLGVSGPSSLTLHEAVLLCGIGLTLAGLAFVGPLIWRARSREMVIRGTDVAIWMPRLHPRLRTMVWHPIADSTLRIHPLTVDNVLWSGHVLALEVGKYRMLLAAARDRSELDAVTSRLPAPIRVRWNAEPGPALIARKGNRYIIRPARPSL